MKELKKELRSGSLAGRVYLFYGEEGYLIKKYEQSFASCIDDGGFADMNRIHMDGKGATAEAIIENAETPPFMAERRIITVREAGFFKTGRKDDSERLAEYIEKCPEFAVLLFIEAEIDKRGKLYKAVNKYGRAVEFKTPAERELISWIAKEAKAGGAYIGGAEAAHMLRCVGDNMEALAMEAAKLADYAGEGGKISLEDIDCLCAKSIESRVFDLVGALGNKNADAALGIYRNMLLMKEQPIMVLSMLARQFRIILQSKSMAKDGAGAREIAEATGLREFVVREGLKQAANFTEGSLKEALSECLNTDVDIKTGRIDAAVGVELLIIKYA